jgi:hypothetical protein
MILESGSEENTAPFEVSDYVDGDHAPLDDISRVVALDRITSCEHVISGRGANGPCHDYLRHIFVEEG